MTIQKSVLMKARQKNFKPSRVARFLSQSRNFNDSGVLGRKDFVAGAWAPVSGLV